MPFLALLAIELGPYLLIDNIIKYPIKANKGKLVPNSIRPRCLLP